LQRISETLVPLAVGTQFQDAYRQNMIEDPGCIPMIVGLTKSIGLICIYLINTLNPVTYKITISHALHIFQKARTLSGKYQLLS